MIETQPIIELNNVSLVYKTRLAFFKSNCYTALNKISFSINKGETIGIIGKNGCGKSTLLKLLAGVFSPDSGTINRHCKNVSLLTLGVGFDNQLSGIDNAMVSAMLLGATKKQAKIVLPKILEYADIGDFIYQPVKSYSTGMRARLGFAIATIIDVDLLLIDEVLGVGDAQFKQKATKTMLEKINSDQTVVFVSHDVNQVKQLCQRVLWIEKGSIKMLGSATEVYNQYRLQH